MVDGGVGGGIMGTHQVYNTGPTGGMLWLSVGASSAAWVSLRAKPGMHIWAAWVHRGYAWGAYLGSMGLLGG